MIIAKFGILIDIEDSFEFFMTHEEVVYHIDDAIIVCRQAHQLFARLKTDIAYFINTPDDEMTVAEQNYFNAINRVGEKFYNDDFNGLPNIHSMAVSFSTAGLMEKAYPCYYNMNQQGEQFTDCINIINNSFMEHLVDLKTMEEEYSMAEYLN